MNGRRQSGTALITALLIVALASVTAVAMLERQQFSLRRTENLLHADQAYLYALGVEAWAIGQLRRDVAAPPGERNFDAPTEPWARPLPPTAVEGGQIDGLIVDAQGLFNLRNLAPPTPADGTEPPPEAGTVAGPELALLRRLLRTLDIEPALAQAIGDWIDGDINPSFPDGAEDLHYLGLDPPYRSANGAPASPSELRLVAGITPAVYAALAPLVTALPEPTPINVNSAPTPVLAALADGIDVQAAQTLVDERAERPFETTAAFLERVAQLPGIDNEVSSGLAPLIAVASDYFFAIGNASVGRARVRLVSLIHRSDRRVAVIARSQAEF